MLIKTVKINELHESVFNPRIKLEKSSKEYRQIADSVKKFGFVEPLVVNEHNMCVIGGHQRLQILKDSGATQVECVMINEIDPEREKTLCIALNKIKGDWDMEKLAHLLGRDEISAFPTGFEEGEVDLEKYLKDTIPTELMDEPEDALGTEAEEKETATVIKIGGFSFTVKAKEYYALIDDIRDNGIFEPSEIKIELQRRILND